MALFSQRSGHTPLKRDLQLEEVDEALRNGLWSAVEICYWRSWEPMEWGNQPQIAREIETMCTRIWLHLYKKPIDSLPVVSNNGGYGNDFIAVTRTYFYSCPWYEVYDLLEFMCKNGPQETVESFSELCNRFLERDNSAYRVVNSEITQITNETEIKSIEDSARSKYHQVNEHISSALHLLSDRHKPDYRNSIKESISALESLCAILCEDPKATLGQAIKRFPDLHPAFVKGVSNLYGYTSDADGIRHALMEKSTITFADAKFMLVACSGLVNYLIAKQIEK